MDINELEFEEMKGKIITVANVLITGAIVLISMGIGFSVAVDLMRRGIIQ